MRDSKGRFIKGHSFTSLMIRKMSESKKGAKRTDEWRKEVSERMKGNKFSLGKKHTVEWKKGQSLRMKKAHENGRREVYKKIGKSLTGKKLSKEHIKKLRERITSSKTKAILREYGLKRVMKVRLIKGPTSIEKILYKELEAKKIIFEKQKMINNRFLVDAYIPSDNLIIEADGKFWHSIPRVMKKDKAENAYLKKCGYKLLRLPEQDILDGSFAIKIK